VKGFDMKSILTAVFAAGATLLAGAAPVHAQVSIRAPGVAIEAGPQPYWLQHHDDHEAEWRRRSEFREAESRRNDWQREHCVRDWSGRDYCRR
jgi:hypothetical protein